MLLPLLRDSEFREACEIRCFEKISTLFRDLGVIRKCQEYYFLLCLPADCEFREACEIRYFEKISRLFRASHVEIHAQLIDMCKCFFFSQANWCASSSCSAPTRLSCRFLTSLSHLPAHVSQSTAAIPRLSRTETSRSCGGSIAGKHSLLWPTRAVRSCWLFSQRIIDFYGTPVHSLTDCPSRFES